MVDIKSSPCMAEQIVDLIRAVHPKYFSRHAISTAEAIELIEQYAAVVAGEAAIKATSESYDRAVAAFDDAMSKPLASVGADCTCLMCIAEGDNSPHRLRAPLPDIGAQS